MSSQPRLTPPARGIRWRGLTLQMFILIIVPLTALVLIIPLGGLHLHQEAMRNLVGARDERAARAAASTLTEQLNHRASAIHGLALRASPNLKADELRRVLETSDFLLPDFDQGLAIFTRDGKALAISDDSGFWKSQSELTTAPLKALLTRDVPPPFTLTSDPSRGEFVMVVAATITKGGPIALGAFSPYRLAQKALASALPPGEQSAAFVVDQDNQLLYQRGGVESGELPVTHRGVAEALRGESGTTYLSVNGREHVVAFTPVAPVGWALVFEEPWDTVASPLLRTTEAAPLVMVPALILAMVALWLGARKIVQPLQALEAQAASLAWGDYQAIETPVGGIEEITSLQRTLVYLASRIQGAQQSLRSYIGAITSGQEEERRRLARELHDDTIQALIALNQRVQLARLALNGSPPAEMLDEIHTMTEQTIQDLRQITRALRPHYLEDLGLVAALDMLAQEVRQVSGVQVHFQRHGSPQRLSPNEELTLYRIAQEGLSNVARHARAGNAFLTIHFTPQAIKLTVADDGQGFSIPESPAEFAASGHFGLLGMHERAELIAADLEIDSQPGQGTQITVTLQLSPKPT